MKKRLFFSIIVMLLAQATYSQSPEKFNYQAVVRDVSGNVIGEKNVALKISILQGSSSGNSVYIETHSPVTNKSGLINLIIGGGTVVSGTLSGIEWQNDLYFIKLEIDPNGGINFSEMGTMQLLSVPYSIHSNTADKALSIDYSLVENKPNLSTYITTKNAGKWDKDSTNDVTLAGDQSIDGRKTFEGPVTINNSLKASLNKVTNTISGENTNTSITGFGHAIYGNHTNSKGTAIKGTSPHIGVFGESTAENGTHYGVYGTSLSGNGAGVYGSNSSLGGKGVYGYASVDDGITYGVYGEAKGSGGRGLFGISTSTEIESGGVGVWAITKRGYCGVYAINESDGPFSNKFGVLAITKSQEGTGVRGAAVAETGMNIGVEGLSNSNLGIGVWGVAMSNSGPTIGVRGTSHSVNGFDFYAFGSGTDYGSESSVRWKNDIVPITGALDKIRNLNGVYFTWNKEHGGHHSLGFIGEEVAKYFPEIVINDPEAPGYILGMDYSRMSPVLLQAINEQQVIIENQQKQIDDLLKRLEVMESK